MTVESIPVAAADPSLVVEQMAALRAGVALLAMVDGQAEVELSVSSFRTPSFELLELSVQVSARPPRWGAGERDAGRLHGMRVLAEILGLSVDVYDDPETSVAHLGADTRIAGVPVRVWTFLSDPDVVAAAHLSFPAVGGSR